MVHLGNEARKYIKVRSEGNNLMEVELFTDPNRVLYCYCYYILYFQLPNGREDQSWSKKASPV